MRRPPSRTRPPSRRRLPGSRAACSEARAAADDRAPAVDRHRGDDHDAADDVLQERVDLHDAHDVVDDREDRDAADRTPDRAASAQQQRAAEHDRGDRQQRVAALLADGGAADAETAGEQQTGEPCEHRAQHVRGDQRRLGAHPGQAGDLRVAADRVEVGAGAGAVEQEPDEHGERDHDDRRDGNGPDAGGADELELPGHAACRALEVGVEDALQNEPHAEGGDEAVDLEHGDDQAVDQADACADEQGEGDGRRHVRGVPVHDRRSQQARETHDVGHRQIERCSEHHQGLADRDESEHAHAGEDVADVPGAEEVAPHGADEDGADDEGQDQDAEDDDRRVDPKPLHRAPPSMVAPVAAPRISCSADPAGSSATSSPSCITRIRSLMPITSGSSLDTISTALP